MLLFLLEGENMSNPYLEMREKQQTEINAFPLAFAFSKEQFVRGMMSLGLSPEDTDKIYRLGDTGGFYRRSDADALHEMLDRHEQEHLAAIEADKGDGGYTYHMFCEELANHEYGYTRDAEPALEALGLTSAEIEKNPKLLSAYGRAIKAQSSDPF